jgi:hypothetical protein
MLLQGLATALLAAALASLALVRYMETLLYGVEPIDLPALAKALGAV